MQFSQSFRIDISRLMTGIRRLAAVIRLLRNHPVGHPIFAVAGKGIAGSRTRPKTRDMEYA